MEKRYRVTLTGEEREQLRAMVSTGKAAARKLVRARVLLLADQAEGGPAKSDPEIIDALGCGRATVERVRHANLYTTGSREDGPAPAFSVGPSPKRACQWQELGDNIGGDRDCAGAEFFNMPFHLVGCGGIAGVIYDAVIAFLRECDDDGAADAAGCAGDEGDGALAHGAPWVVEMGLHQTR